MIDKSYADRLRERTRTVVEETREALETVYGELNNGQRKKLMKNGKIVELFDRYGVNHE